MTEKKIRVVIVDDSQTMRMMLARALHGEGIEVVGEAADPYEARDVIKKVNPDVITLDVEMPGMNGLEFLEKIIRLRPTPVVMVSAYTARGADVSISALEIGAVDVALKPSGGVTSGFRHELRAMVRSASQADLSRHALRSRAAAASRAGGVSDKPRVDMSGPRRVSLIAIGSSTGGVSALHEILDELPADAPPIVITQHMPDSYIERFSERMNAKMPHHIAAARDGETLEPGMVRIAPGGVHLEVGRSGASFKTRLVPGDLVSGHRPSVDMLFMSVARSAAASALGVILTGMGRDGASGLLEMRNAGAATIGESEATCVAYGMPRVAFEIGAVQVQADRPAIPALMASAVRSGAKFASEHAHQGAQNASSARLKGAGGR